MATERVALSAFNRGIVSKLALARTDLKRTALSAEISTNWIPRLLGSQMVRPGLGYLGDTYTDAQAYYIPFVFSLTDKALIELTNLVMRVWVNDVPVTRVSVATAITNGTFDTNITGWTDNSEAGGSIAWNAGTYLAITGTGTNAGIADQQVTVALADQAKEHALRIVIPRGPVTLKIGTAVGLDDIRAETSLDTGTHSIAFTPNAASFWVRLMSRNAYVVYVDQCTIEAAGVLTLPTPWILADIPLARYDTSGDITFVACKGYQQRSIERRSTTSWSVVTYSPNDGPFLTQNLTKTTLAPSALTGDVTLTASTPIFRSTHVGALFSITSVGQDVSFAATALNDVTPSIKVTGVTTSRAFTIILSGFFDGVRTMIVERSYDNLTGWTAVPTLSWTAAVTTSYTDGLDNQIVYYRLRVSVVGGAGTTNMELKIGTGSITGIGRVTAFTNTTTVSAQVLSAFGGTTASVIWAEGSWSTFRGFPSAVSLHQGRLWWAGKSFEWGSVSDGYYSFDATVLGDSGTIARSIGFGPVDSIAWLLSTQRLLMGGEMAEFETVTSSLDEPVTPTNFGIRAPSTQGSADVQAIKLDANAIFVRRGGLRVFQFGIDPIQGDFSSTDLTAIVPDFFENPNDSTVDKSVKRIAIQRLPDTRLHCVRADGTVGILVWDRVEQVTCWVNLTTDGVIEDVAVLPGTPEDQVYYSIKRTINGVTKRYLERWALEAEARGGTVNKIADSFIVYSGGLTTVITGLSTLEAKTVCVWGNSKDLGTYTVTGGQITVSEAVSYAVVGLVYTAQWQSAKLAYAAQLGTSLNQKKIVNGLGVVLADTHAQGITYGPTFSTLDPLPQMEDGVQVDQNSVWSEYDKPSFDFAGQWDTDSRVCLQGTSPRPCTLLALTMLVHTAEKMG